MKQLENINLNAVEAAASAVAKSPLPSAAAVATHFANVSLPDWAAIAGIAFILLQAAFIVWKWRREWKNGEVEDKS